MYSDGPLCCTIQSPANRRWQVRSPSRQSSLDRHRRRRKRRRRLPPRPLNRTTTTTTTTTRNLHHLKPPLLLLPPLHPLNPTLTGQLRLRIDLPPTPPAYSPLSTTSATSDTTTASLTPHTQPLHFPQLPQSIRESDKSKDRARQTDGREAEIGFFDEVFQVHAVQGCDECACCYS